MTVKTKPQRANGAPQRKFGPSPPYSGTLSTTSAASDPKRSVHLGLKVLVPSQNPSIDIIALHGLGGHRDLSFTARNRTNWLRDADMLPAWIPHARVLSYGYDAQASQPSKRYLEEQAEMFVREVCWERRAGGVEGRPILFVAHCLGGLVLKKALLTATNSLLHATHGIIYIGTPHSGGTYTTLRALFSPTSSSLLGLLSPSSAELHDLRQGYRRIHGRWDTKFAYETHKTSRRGLSAVSVVPKASASIADVPGAENLAIHADHTGMVRFASAEAQGFKTLAGHLTLMARRAQGVGGG